MFPFDGNKIESFRISDTRQGKNIYTKKHLEELANFQDIQGTRTAYLAETAQLVYGGRNENGEWGLALEGKHYQQ
jgi:hypothetical protein